MKILLRERFYVPESAVNLKRLSEVMEVAHLDKSACRPGCPMARKPGRFCSTCPAAENRIKMWERVKTKSGRDMIAVPSGDSSLLKKILKVSDYQVVDKRCAAPMQSKLRWTGSLRKGGFDAKGNEVANQKMMLQSWVKHVANETGGIVISPPRSGKCVVAGTMIRTDRGYLPIEDLFLGHDMGQDRVGSFGTVAAPASLSTITGLHSRMTDSTVRIRLENGVEISGTPEHPIVVVRKRASWKRLSDVEPGMQVLFPPELDPTPKDQGFTESEAGLVGHFVAFSDLAQLKAGTVDLREAAADYSEVEDLKYLLREVLSCPTLGVMELEGKLARWQSTLLASGDAAWRAFFRTAFSCSMFSRTPSLLLPDFLARAATYHLLGKGVDVAIKRDPYGMIVVVHNRESLTCYLGGKRPPGADRGLLYTVRRSTTLKKSQQVFDISVAETRSFLANGVGCHNTVIGVGAIMSRRLRTLVTASKMDFLRQFGKRFGELTNLKELYAKGVYPVVLIDPQGWKDAAKFGVLALKKWGPEVHRADVILATYQQFLSPDLGAKRIRKYINNKVGMLEVDEVHQAAAPCFSRVANRLNVRLRLGLTATLIRKDGLQPVVSAVLGATTVIGRVTSTLPRVELLETGVSSAHNYKNWNSMESFLARHEERNRIVVRQVFKDLRANKNHFILLPVTRVAHNQALVKMINAQAEYCRRNRDEDWPVDLAVAYKGGSDTNEVLNQVHAGRARVIVATYSMIKYGLDVQRWTHVFIGIIPTSNAPNVYQALNRVCTPYTPEMEDTLGPKPQPVVRFVVDEMSASVYCLAKLYNNPDYGLAGAFSGKNYYNVRLAKAEPSVAKRLYDIAKYPKSYSAADAGVKKVLGVTATGRKRRKSAWKSAKSGIKRL